MFSLGTLLSSRTTEYYVLLNLRANEKRKYWIWIGFQSGPLVFVRTIAIEDLRKSSGRNVVFFPSLQPPLDIITIAIENCVLLSIL